MKRELEYIVLLTVRFLWNHSFMSVRGGIRSEK